MLTQKEASFLLINKPGQPSQSENASVDAHRPRETMEIRCHDGTPRSFRVNWHGNTTDDYQPQRNNDFSNDIGLHLAQPCHVNGTNIGG